MKTPLRSVPVLCSVLALTVLTLVGCKSGSGPSGNTPRINGAGSSFVFPAMTKWTKSYNAAKGTQIDYVSKGSSAGIQQMTEKTLDFGATDAPMKKDQVEKAKGNGGEVVHIPLVIGGVVPAYNVPGVDATLQFTGPVLADIYLGKIKKWNDAAMQAANPGVNLPDLAITPVYRAEGSGTSNIWTEYLSKVSPEFKKTVGIGTTPSWPKGVGVGMKDNAGVAGHVERTAGAIGYVELAFALQNKIKYGAVKNKAGKFIQANLESMTAAAMSATQAKPTDEPYSLHELTYSLTDMDGEKSYPIGGIAYAIFYRNLATDKKKVLLDFLHWATHEGQAMTKELDYAPLPDELVKAIDTKLSALR